ncbi:endonuclease-reverse transcriptase [Elysia marginata]|uniref:Endonuclease-reverse transcriptase n=1 Tax=Elysia marginata TaxID=1093978 RepID=A0AAV4I9D4_9GAST|nr:endonuclease-reverse transcriptase [Elysia marginata]
MKNKEKLKDTNIHISEDHTPRIREIRRKLGTFLNKFRNEGKRATMVYDHLIVDGARLCWDPITGTVRSPLQTQHQASDRAPHRAPRGAPDRVPDRASGRVWDLTPDRITDRDQERTPSTQHSNRGVVQSSRATRGNAATTNE